MNKNKLLMTTVLGMSCALGGCQAYTERHEGVTSFAGNSLPVNEAKMAADPWKRNAYNDHIHADGERLGDAVKRYKSSNSEKSGNSVQPIILPAMQGTETN